LNQLGDFNSPKHSNNSDSKFNSKLIEVIGFIAKNKMSETNIFLETAIKLVLAFNGVYSIDVYTFFNSYEFVMLNVESSTVETSIVIRNSYKVKRKTFAITLHQKIKDW